MNAFSALNLTLWVEGAPSKDAATLQDYYRYLANFIAGFNIRKVIVRIMNPAAFQYFGPDHGTPLFVTNFVELLPPDCILYVLPSVSTVDSQWAWRPMLPGGVEGSNPNDLAPTGAGCPINYPNDVKWATRAQWPQWPACPNTLQQVAAWVAVVNPLIRKGPKITGMVFDLEGGGLYRKDKAMFLQVAAAVRQCALGSDFKIGVTGAPPMNPADLGVDEVFPQMYWIGENAAVGCTASLEPQCRNTIYVQNKDQPTQMLQDFAKFFPNALDTGEGICHLFSCEQYWSDAQGPENPCVNNKYGKADAGTFNGFGVWRRDSFADFLSAFAEKYNTTNIGVFQFNMMPTAWIDTP